MKTNSFITLLLVLFIYSESKASDKDFQKEAFHIFLLMGQSNMAGYGDIMPEDKKTIEEVYMLRDTIDRKADFGWVEARQPIHNRLASDRFCLAGSFAKAYKEMYPRATVGLIPMGWGGAPITKMNQGTPFYNEVLKKVLWAKKQGCLKAILWHQGESDTVKPEDAQSYKARLKKLIEDLRKDLNEPDLMFIIGDLAPFYGTNSEHSAPDRVQRIQQVRDALKNMQYELPRVGFVSSEGLHSHDHHQVHFDRNSYIIFGHRYFDKYWQINNQ